MTRKLINEDEVTLLLKKCRDKNEAAFEKVYKLTAALLNHFAMGIVQNEALSNEIIQDSFIQIWENASYFDVNKGKPLNWMRTIVKNKAIDKLRAENKHYKLRPADNDEYMAEAKAEDSIKPEMIAARQQLQGSVKKMLSELPNAQRRSIRLAYYNGYSRLELADAMDTNINTIKSWLRRGLKTMKRCHLQHSIEPFDHNPL